ncbi:MAG: metallopeptidase [Planctomycetales bacterium]|nr:metallopeptidase [Planctomycetales bacterium]
MAHYPHSIGVRRLEVSYHEFAKESLTHMWQLFRLTTVFCLVVLSALASQSRAEGAGRFFDPIEQAIEGWTVAIDPQLLAGEHQSLGEQAVKALANHLQRITFIVPEDRLVKLKKLRIWLEFEHPELKSMQYHPDRGWLLANQHDPRLVKHVHIPQARHLIEAHTWAKHPYVILHELAHAYHDQVLNFDNPEVIAVFDAAKGQGIYEEVLLYTGKKVKHYGLSNHKEYFAESTEAYFGVNDFYPFVRAELNEHDPAMFTLLEKIWGRVE